MRYINIARSQMFEFILISLTFDDTLWCFGKSEHSLSHCLDLWNSRGDFSGKSSEKLETDLIYSTCNFIAVYEKQSRQ